MDNKGTVVVRQFIKGEAVQGVTVLREYLGDRLNRGALRAKQSGGGYRTGRDIRPNRRSEINTCWLSKQNASGLISPLAEIPHLISHTKIFYVNVHPAPD